MAEGSSKRIQLVLAVVAVVAVAVVVVVFSGGDDDHAHVADTPPDGESVGRSSSGSGQSIATGDHDDHAHGPGRYEDGVALDAGPGARRVFFPGEGWATVVDDPNADAPPPIDSIPENPDPPSPPPEELPQTARWKLGKTERMTEVLTGRVDRLETRIEAARRSGDDEQVQRLETLLSRTRMRIDRLEQEAEELREQAAQEPPEEEVVEEWQERTGLTPEQLIERNREELPPPPGGEPGAPPPSSP